MARQPTDEDQAPRKSWFGANQRRPRLPTYLHPKKRLKGLDEYSDPPWKGRMKFDDGKKVTVGGVVRETLRFLAIFAIIFIVGGTLLQWQRTDEACWRLRGEFMIGWC